MTRTIATLFGTSLLAMSMVAGVAEAKTQQGGSGPQKSGGAKSSGSKSSGSKSSGSKSSGAKSGGAKSGGAKSVSKGSSKSNASAKSSSGPKPNTTAKTIAKPNTTTKIAKPAGTAGTSKVTKGPSKLPGAIGALGLGAGAAAAAGTWKADAAKGPQKDSKGKVSSQAMSTYVSKQAAAKHASIVPKASSKHAGAKALAQRIAFKGWGSYKTVNYTPGGYVCSSCGPLVIIINAITREIYYPGGYSPSSFDYDNCDYVVVGKTQSDCGCDDDQED